MPRSNAHTMSLTLPPVWSNLLIGTSPRASAKASVPGDSCDTATKTSNSSPSLLLAGTDILEGNGLKQLCSAPMGLFWWQIPGHLSQGGQCLQEQLWSHPALHLPNREYHWISSWATQIFDDKTQSWNVVFFLNSRKTSLVRTTSTFYFILMVTSWYWSKSWSNMWSRHLNHLTAEVAPP